MRFASIGDCCADIYQDHVVLGGTAYNVALAASKTGAQTSIISAIGSDDIGKQFIESFKTKNINVSHLSIISGKTDTINIRLDDHARPHYSNWKTDAIETVHLSDPIFLQSHNVARAVLFTSTQRLFREFCALNLGSTLKVGDFAGTSADSFDANVIEQYAKNLDVIIKSIENNQSLSILQNIAKKYNCIVLGLLGSKGSVVFTKNTKYTEPAIPVQTKNTTGAGDVYQAYFLIEYIKTKEIQTSMRVATRAATTAIR